MLPPLTAGDPGDRGIGPDGPLVTVQAEERGQSTGQLLVSPAYAKGMRGVSVSAWVAQAVVGGLSALGLAAVPGQLEPLRLPPRLWQWGPWTAWPLAASTAKSW